MSTGAGEAVPGRPEEAGTPVLLDRLSDEELVLLGAEHPLVHLPHHARLAAAEQARAVVGALRGLRARGHEVDSDRRTIALPQYLGDLLDLRSSAGCVLMVQVLVPGPDDREPGIACQHYAFIVDDFVLLEDVSDDGLHDFWGLDRADLAAALQERSTVAGARDGVGSPLEVDLPRIAAGGSRAGVDRLGRPLAQIDATVWRAPATPEPPLQAIVLGDAGSYVSVATAGAEGPVTLTPIAVSGVGEEVVALLGPDTMSR